MHKMDLNNDWLLRCEELHWGPEMLSMVTKRENGWLNTNLPCDVHMPLIEAGIIKEPLEADHCFDCEWVEEKSWWFKKAIDVDQKLFENDIIELTLESLDMEADVFLNGVHLGHHRSAFYPFHTDVKKILRVGENLLVVRLSSGLEYFSELDLAPLKKCIVTETDQGRVNRGDMRRVFTRKPQYVYGWDWGPRVATCGIVKDVYLKSFNKIAVDSVRAFTKSAAQNAEIGFDIEIRNLHPFSTRDALLKVEVSYEGDKVTDIEQVVFLRSGLNYVNLNCVIEDARLWWPNGMGTPSLYSVKVAVSSDNIYEEYPEFQYGIRTLALNLEKTGPAERRFAFEINGVRTFCKGGNWIPADSIYARVSDEKYDTLIREAKNANFNMLRVWGGGIYERDVFYRKCDEYGIMLWHDFMFACALYPDHLEWFRREVEKEIDYQTKRLRNHPSLVLWCGNNENHWAFDEWWIDRKSEFLGGTLCYNEIAPRIIRRNCPDIPYWNSSPYGGEHPNGNNVGDRHHWNDCTMHPEMERRITPEEYDKVIAKFVSEYGYIGPCRKSSIIKYHGEIPVDKGGRIWQLHNNTFEKDTVPAGIAKHYINPTTLSIDEYLLYAGLCQGLMLGYSLEALRFKESCWGSLFWMYNDCWGEVGWTIIDYYTKRKISYYFVKRAFEPVKIILRKSNGFIQAIGVNETAAALEFDVKYGAVNINDNTGDCSHRTIRLEPFSRNRILEFEQTNHDRNYLYYVKPVIPNCKVNISPAILRERDFRELSTVKADFHIANFRRDNDNVRFVVSSNAYTHAVHFDLGDDIHLSDEYFDLLPGESREIIIFNAPDNLTADALNPKSIQLPEK